MYLCRIVVYLSSCCEWKTPVNNNNKKNLLLQVFISESDDQNWTFSVPAEYQQVRGVYCAMLLILSDKNHSTYFFIGRKKRWFRTCCVG